MRWLAAFMVFAFHIHVIQYFGPATTVGGSLREAILGVGAVGVSFFFILSGFVLAWSFRPGEGARTFWRRRFARIYPLHAATVVIALVIGVTLAAGTLPTRVEVLLNVLLVQPWFPTSIARDYVVNPVSWSLACEAFFYALFPLLFAGVRRLGTRGLWIAGTVSLLAVVLLPVVADFRDMHRIPVARLPEFVLGSVLACLVRAGKWRGPGVVWSAVVLAAGCAVATVAPADFRYTACTAPGFALLIAATAVADARGVRSWLARPWLVRLGELSFAFYMIHILMVRVGEALFARRPHLPVWPALGASVALFVASLTMAWLLYELIEKPARRLLVRSRRKKLREPAAEAAMGDPDATGESAGASQAAPAPAQAAPAQAVPVPARAVPVPAQATDRPAATWHPTLKPQPRPAARAHPNGRPPAHPGRQNAPGGRPQQRQGGRSHGPAARPAAPAQDPADRRAKSAVTQANESREAAER
jgi:peptidoglycan/LPS O-acetylase OafA/YrhL